MHIHPAILESYAAGELSQPQLASVDAHVSNCLFCAHAIADHAVISETWERRGWLGRLVRVDAPPVVAQHVEQLDAAA